MAEAGAGMIGGTVPVFFTFERQFHLLLKIPVHGTPMEVKPGMTCRKPDARLRISGAHSTLIVCHTGQDCIKKVYSPFFILSL